MAVLRHDDEVGLASSWMKNRIESYIMIKGRGGSGLVWSNRVALLAVSFV